MPGRRTEARLASDARKIFGAGLAAVDPESLVRNSLKRKGPFLSVGGRRFDLRSVDRVLVVGAGKAAAAMARAAEGVLGERISQGVVAVKYGHELPLERVRVIQAGHPVPDRNGIRAAREIRKLVSTSGKRDLILCLLSGGGSALIEDPQPGITLADLRRTTGLLLACGAEISEVNTVRKHLSRIKGGGLAAAAYPSPLVCLILSDVIGDDLTVIASGPTVPDTTTFGEAWDLVKRHGLVKRLPERVADYLKRGCRGEVPETPKAGAACFRRAANRIVGNNAMAVAAAASQARKLGYRPLVLTTAMRGEAREVGTFLCAMAGEVMRYDRPVKKPACLIAGGETTVTLRGKGKGGRNQEMVLAAVPRIAGWRGVLFLAAGTDGTDGPTDAAGAIADGTTSIRARQNAMEVTSYLNRNDAYHFFRRLGGLVITGPTLTNVMDLSIILVT